MGYGDKFPRMILEDIRKQSLGYGVDKKLARFSRHVVRKAG